MKRRDFLLFRSTRQGRVIEIPCQRVYMHYLAASATEPRGDHDPAADPMAGEPPAAFDGRSPGDVIGALDAQLQDVDLVRVIDRHWLASETLSQEFDAFLESFVARGGRVEFVSGGTKDD